MIEIDDKKRIIASIEPVKSSDLETIAEIAVQAFEVHYDFYRKELGDAIFDLMHANWRRNKKNAVKKACSGENGYQGFVAKYEDRIVGFLTMKTDPQTKMGVISNNGVKPKWQGRGIGKQMFSFAIERMKQEGMKFARVDTGLGPTFAPARGAYERNGFDKSLKTVQYYMDL